MLYHNPLHELNDKNDCEIITFVRRTVHIVTKITWLNMEKQNISWLLATNYACTTITFQYTLPRWQHEYRRDVLFCHPYYTNKTRKQSETADLRQHHVVRQVAAPYSVWQWFPLCPIESNVNENFKVIQNPGFLQDHPQNWITGSFAIPDIPRKFQKDPSITFWVVLLTHRQTDRVSEWVGFNVPPDTV